MSLYRAVPPAASAAVPGGWPPELAGAGIVAVRVADLASPLRRPLREGDRTALTVAGGGKIRTGDLVVFCKPVAVAPAVVRRDGRVQAGGHPADHARLGVIEQQLDEMAGQPGVIDAVAAQTVPRGKVKGTARRSMTMAAALRAVLLMGLMPQACYGEILSALFGDLALLPWHVPFAVPADTVLATWRDAAGPEPVLRLQDMVLKASDAGHQEHDYRAIQVGDLRLGSVDGSVTRMPDTPGNRAEFGSAGTADDSAPYPQLRDLPVTDASTRGMLAVVTGPSGGDKAAAGQALLDRALTGYAWVFTKDRLFVMDRNFPGRLPHQEAGQGHARADPPQKRHHGHEDRGLPARRVLPGRYRRERRHDPDAGHRVLRGGRRPAGAGDVLPGHRPGRLGAVPGGRAGRRV